MTRPDTQISASFFKQLYKTGVTPLFDLTYENSLPEFSEEELRCALKQLKCKKSDDKYGISAEMLKNLNDMGIRTLLGLLNDLLRLGSIPDNWYETHLILIHKSGDNEDPNNWRRIAILSIMYKVMALLVFNRINPILSREQSDDQYGFRSGRSCSHALLVLESIISKSIEFNMPAWTISLDLRKAFDRVEHEALFDALPLQGLDEGYIALLKRFYQHQRGDY